MITFRDGSVWFLEGDTSGVINILHVKANKCGMQFDICSIIPGQENPNVYLSHLKQTAGIIKKLNLILHLLEVVKIRITLVGFVELEFMQLMYPDLLTIDIEATERCLQYVLGIEALN